MRKMFHKAPERCADYKTVTGATEKDYPHAINTHGWVENDLVGIRTLVIWSNITKVVFYWQ